MCRRHLKELFSKFRSSSASDRTSRLDPASSSSEACYQKSQFGFDTSGANAVRLCHLDHAQHNDKHVPVILQRTWTPQFQIGLRTRAIAALRAFIPPKMIPVVQPEHHGRTLPPETHKRAVRAEASIKSCRKHNSIDQYKFSIRLENRW